MVRREGTTAERVVSFLRCASVCVCVCVCVRGRVKRATASRVACQEPTARANCQLATISYILPVFIIVAPVRPSAPALSSQLVTDVDPPRTSSRLALLRPFHSARLPPPARRVLCRCSLRRWPGATARARHSPPLALVCQQQIRPPIAWLLKREAGAQALRPTRRKRVPGACAPLPTSPHLPPPRRR